MRIPEEKPARTRGVSAGAGFSAQVDPWRPLREEAWPGSGPAALHELVGVGGEPAEHGCELGVLVIAEQAHSTV